MNTYVRNSTKDLNMLLNTSSCHVSSSFFQLTARRLKVCLMHVSVLMCQKEQYDKVVCSG